MPIRRLLVRPGAIGDCLCALPALHHLQTSDTEIWTNGAVAPLIGFGTRVRSLAGTGFDRLGIPGTEPPPPLLDTLCGFDEILSWAGFGQPLLRERLGQLGPRVHFFPALPQTAEGTHVSDWMLGQTAKWHGVHTEPRDWLQPGGRRFLLNNACARTQPPTSPPLVVLHPFSGSPAKNWPLDNFRRLAERLSKSCRIRWCASPEDPLPADLVSATWRHEDLCRLAADVAQASLYIGNDSGITHLAAMLGVPTVVFFGPMQPRQWAPRGSRLYIVSSGISGQPAAAIPYESALPVVETALREIEPNFANNVR